VVTYEAGVDLRFYQNRVGIDYSYYFINATDQIFSVPLAASTGFGPNTATPVYLNRRVMS
jgi:hypothetical protein